MKPVQAGFSFAQPETFQAPSWAFGAPEGQAGVGTTSLVTDTTDNSAPVLPATGAAGAATGLTPLHQETRARAKESRKLHRISIARDLAAAGVVPASCPHQRAFIVGECAHGARRWVMSPCGARECAFCGPVGRARIADKVEHGVKVLWSLGARVAWIVLTYPWDVEKPRAVRDLGEFIRRLRRLNPWIEYAATFELTHRGRLHVNVVGGPWVYVPQRQLCELWADCIDKRPRGAAWVRQRVRVWVKGVSDAANMGAEAAKAYGKEQSNDYDGGEYGDKRVGALAGYLSKLRQSVPEDRRCSFSHGWPKQDEAPPQRVGVIAWDRATERQQQLLATERQLGQWHLDGGELSRAKFIKVQTTAGDALVGNPEAETCTCFHWKERRPVTTEPNPFHDGHIEEWRYTVH